MAIRSEADINEMTLEQLQNKFRLDVQAANKRLQRTERYAQQPGYKGMLNYAYRVAIKDIEAMRGTGKTRFSTKVPQTRRELLKQIRIVNEYLDLPSSTKKGVKEIYKKSAKTLSEEYGMEIDWEDVRDMFETGLYDAIYILFGDSKIAMKCIANITRNKDSLRRAIEQGRRVSFSGAHARDLTEFFNQPANYRILADYLGYPSRGPSEEEEDELPF